MGEAEGGSMAAEKPATAPAGGGADWDEDDELLAMQQEAWVRPILPLQLTAIHSCMHVTTK